MDDEEPVASTPEDEDVGDIEMYGDNDEEITQKISKKKASKYEENHSKKEHVNVVFIGHVGKLFCILSYGLISYRIRSLSSVKIP